MTSLPLTLKIEISTRAKSFAKTGADSLVGKMLEGFRTVFDPDGDPVTDEDLRNLVFHTEEIDGHEYIMTGGDNPLIDICTRTDMDPLTEGPFAGKTISMPDL